MPSKTFGEAVGSGEGGIDASIGESSLLATAGQVRFLARISSVFSSLAFSSAMAFAMSGLLVFMPALADCSLCGVSDLGGLVCFLKGTRKQYPQ